MRLGFYLLIVTIGISCREIPIGVKKALEAAGNNRGQLEKVIAYYKSVNDRQKLKAAYYLISNLPGQFHYSGEGMTEYRKYFRKMDSIITTRKNLNYELVWDSLQNILDSTSLPKLEMVQDIQVITAEFLIKNIDHAFTAWKYPWAKKLSFDDFCKYILPYKLEDEAPEEWRTYFMKEYKWVVDSLKNKQDPVEALGLINNDLGKRFYLTKLNVPFDLNLHDLLLLRSGKCPQEVQLATYAMRAMGIPVVIEGVPLWGNRNGRHDWNAYVKGNKAFPFLGTEVNPGEYKIEFQYAGSVHSKRAVVKRRTYEQQKHSLSTLIEDKDDIPSLFKELRVKDVTAEYVPVSNVTIPIKKEITGNQVVYLAVYNSLEWKPTHWALVNGKKATFTNVGRDIVYLPVVFEEKNIDIAGRPFLLKKDGTIHEFIPDFSSRVNFKIDKKYPAGQGNFIKAGTLYELLYWDEGQWKLCKRETANSKQLSFTNIPSNALLRLHKPGGDNQERIFTVVNGNVNWW